MEYVTALLDLGQIENNKHKCSITKRFWSYIKGRKRDNVGIPTLKVKDQEYNDSKSKANILSEQFQSVFTNEIPGDIREKKSVPWPSVVENITFDTEGINKLLNNLDPKKACGPDLLPTRILKEAATEIAQILQLIFKKSFENAELPKDWLTANIIAIHKKDNRN